MGMTSGTFSAESGAGHSPSDSLTGQTTGRSSRVPARASRSRSRASKPAPTMLGIYGPTTFDSSMQFAQLSRLGNRLLQRLARVGSTECLLTWKARATPAKRSYFQLVPLTRHTDVIVSGSPRHGELWVTASARDWKDTPGMSTAGPDGRVRIDQLPRQVAAAMWPTAVANDDNKSPEAHMAMKARMKGGPRKCITSLQVMAKAQAAMWPTVQAMDGNKGNLPPRPHDTGVSLPQRMAQTLGDIATGSSDTTAKRGGSRPALSPYFVAWLMGFPQAWVGCAPATTPKKLKAK